MPTGIVTVSEYVTTPNEQLAANDDLEVRGWYTRSFISGDGVTVIEGNFSNGSKGPYYSVFPSLSATGGLVVPAHDIQATTLSNPTGNYIEQLWVNGALSQTLMPNTAVATGWAIPTVYGPVIAFDEIATYNRAKRLVSPPQTYFTTDDTILEINRIAGQLSYAGLNILGRTELSVAPVDPVHPIAVGTNDPRLLSGANIITPQQFGAIADGSSHPLSGVYGSLAAAQAAFDGAYYFVTSLAQEIDYAATKAASNACFGGDLVIITAYTTPSNSSTDSVIIDPTANYVVNTLAGKTLFFRYPNGFISSVPISSNTATTITLAFPLPFGFGHTGSVGGVCGYTIQDPLNIFDCEQYAIGDGEHGFANAKMNKALYFPGGTYVFGNDTWRVRNLVGGTITGAGRYTVNLTSNATVLAFDGLWYTQITGMAFASLTNTAVAALDIDGNIPGHLYATRGVQGNTLKDIAVDGGGSLYAFALARQGQSSAQASENLFLDIHLNNSTFANYYAFGSNALQNTFVGGNFQTYTTNGIYINGGSVEVFSVGFQSTFGYTQIVNDGWDINVGNFGVGERIVVIGCRSESMRFFKNAGSQPGILIGNSNRLGNEVGWVALEGRGLNQITVQTSVSLGVKAYRVTTAGITGAAPPVWPNSGTVADGSMVWTELEFDVVSNGVGTGEYTTNGFQVGNIQTGGDLTSTAIEVQSNYTYVNSYPYKTVTFLVDATAADRTLILNLTTVFAGQMFYVKKYDTSSHTVTIQSDGNGIEFVSTYVIPGGSRGWVVLTKAGGGNLNGAFFVVSSS